MQYQKDQKELQEFLGDAYNNYNLVIALENGNPVESRIVRDRFQKLCEQNGYEQVVFHSLRHLSTGYKLNMRAHFGVSLGRWGVCRESRDGSFLLSF